MDESRDIHYRAHRCEGAEAHAARSAAGLACSTVPVWRIEGPFLSVYFLGVTEHCGEQQARALDMAFEAGRFCESREVPDIAGTKVKPGQMPSRYDWAARVYGILYGGIAFARMTGMTGTAPALIAWMNRKGFHALTVCPTCGMEGFEHAEECCFGEFLARGIEKAVPHLNMAVQDASDEENARQPRKVN